MLAIRIIYRESEHRVYRMFVAFLTIKKKKMPGEIIDQPNPKPLPSHLPDVVDQLTVQLDNIKLDDKDADAIVKFRRAACYIAAGLWLFELDCLQTLKYIIPTNSDDFHPRQCISKARA